MTLALGLMSGTSCDGLSIALADFRNRSVSIKACREYPYPEILRKRLLQASGLKTPALSRLNMELGHFFAEKVSHFLKKTGQKEASIKVIGSHGHTVYHGPGDNPSNTFQIGEPSVLAEMTGLPVVADFRPRDIAAGGEGAPLIPFFDEYFFGSQGPCALQNIGGIGNVTLVGTAKPLAFDTGPGNCLIDLAVQKFSKGRLAYDKGGQIARRGNIDLAAAEKMIRHPFFRKCPPKSTGRELFNQTFINRYLSNKNFEDTAATLTFFTALSIFKSYQDFLPALPKKIIVSGGGAKNLTLMAMLKKIFKTVSVLSIEALGIPVQAKEPAAFAFFALRALEGKINHLPAGTGAKRACILGKMIPGNRRFRQ